jgi:hypothetical protein
LKLEGKILQVLSWRAQKHRFTKNKIKEWKMKLRAKVFQSLKLLYLKHSAIRQRYAALMSGKDLDWCAKVFHVLKNQKNLERNNSRCAHEKIRLNYVFGHWRKLAVRNKNNQIGYEILAEKSKMNTIKTYLKRWRTQLYLNNAEELKAIPFYEETLKRQMANSFVELHNYAKHSKEKKVKAQVAYSYYRFSLLSKALETYKWFIERKQDRRNKVDFLNSISNERIMK